MFFESTASGSDDCHIAFHVSGRCICAASQPPGSHALARTWSQATWSGRIRTDLCAGCVEKIKTSTRAPVTCHARQVTTGASTCVATQRTNDCRCVCVCVSAMTGRQAASPPVHLRNCACQFRLCGGPRARSPPSTHSGAAAAAAATTGASDLAAAL